MVRQLVICQMELLIVIISCQNLLNDSTTEIKNNKERWSQSLQVVALPWHESKEQEKVFISVVSSPAKWATDL